jgi:subtilisin family serine protease
MVRSLCIAAVASLLTASLALAAPPAKSRLDSALRARAQASSGHSRVIVRMAPGTASAAAISAVRGTPGRSLSLVAGQVADVPNSELEVLAAQPGVTGVSLDRRIDGMLERTGGTIGSNWVRDTLGFDGTGVGIAVIDSGVTSWHDDLGASRVTRFVDFVNFQPAAYDDYGHGTHVAGILVGDGHDSGGRRRGIAPGATLLVEKVLDASGRGYISNVIAAIDYAVANKDALHIRIINLSVAANVYESYETDPLTLAARRAVEAGIVIVSAAGNSGILGDGTVHFGGIGAPGNAPWVLTVGASSHNGTVDRSDDTIAPFSSRGPAAVDFQAKPDIVAPGVGIESIADPNSTLFLQKPAMRLWGTVPTVNEPYLSLSGTSMSAPVVSGTIALMLQADPALTPNLVKAVLQFTAESKAPLTALAEGAGFLNARGAVELAQALAAGGSLATSAAGDPTPWSGHIDWGNRRIGGGELRANATAWNADVVWGSTGTPAGEPIAWGGEPPLNIVWGDECGGADCVGVPWGIIGSGEIDNVIRSSTQSGTVGDVRWPPPAILRGRDDREPR